MKSKIIAISLLTLILVSLSALILQKSIRSIIVTENVLPSFGKSTDLTEYESFDKMIEVPAFKGRTGAPKSYGAGSSENQSNYNFPQIKSGETMFSTTNSVGMENNNYRGAGKRNHNSPVNNSAIAMNNSVIGTPIDRSGGFSSGTVADRRETAVAQVKEPFSASNSMIPGPMRMEDVDENPPPEGMPVGEGIWILLILAGAYIFYRKKG